MVDPAGGNKQPKCLADNRNVVETYDLNTVPGEGQDNADGPRRAVDPVITE